MSELITRYKHYIAAGSEKASPKILNELSHSVDPAIRARVAENPAAPLSTLLRLMLDQSPEVKIGLSNNPALLQSVISELAEDENPDVRFAMAENPQLPGEVLQRLADDDNPYVARRASTTLNNLPALHTATQTVAA